MKRIKLVMPKIYKRINDVIKVCTYAGYPCRTTTRAKNQIEHMADVLKGFARRNRFWDRPTAQKRDWRRPRPASSARDWDWVTLERRNSDLHPAAGKQQSIINPTVSTSIRCFGLDFLLDSSPRHRCLSRAVSSCCPPRPRPTWMVLPPSSVMFWLYTTLRVGPTLPDSPAPPSDPQPSPRWRLPSPKNSQRIWRLASIKIVQQPNRDFETFCGQKKRD